MRTKANDYRKVDNIYTCVIGMSVWRFFNVGKYKHVQVKKICYYNPTYITWCLSNWNGFKLTAYERFEYIKGLKRQLERNPNDNGLIRQIKVQEVLYNREPEL